jgi:predicted O-linked N-acetylglucosamine transferase (SPINDLY family)
MRILRRVPAWLWLRDMPEVARNNLAREASRAGVDPARLLYAGKAPTVAEHQSRLSLADLFLDTNPYNAHTTASDALGAGVPVITLRGESFASRVATSLLHAVGLPQLSVETLAAYEDLAVSLAGSPSVIADLKTHLRRARTTSAACDTVRYCRNLESAYLEIHARHLRGESASPLWV